MAIFESFVVFHIWISFSACRQTFRFDLEGYLSATEIEDDLAELRKLLWH
jgi:hypothetical protein